MKCDNKLQSLFLTPMLAAFVKLTGCDLDLVPTRCQALHCSLCLDTRSRSSRCNALAPGVRLRYNGCLEIIVSLTRGHGRVVHSGLLAAACRAAGDGASARVAPTAL